MYRRFARSGADHAAISTRDSLTMHRRMFLKLLPVILAGPSGGRLFPGAPEETPSGGKLTNWAGNYRYSTDELHRFASVEEVRKFVKDHDSLRALGTRHCFNGIADSTQALVSL